MVSYSISGTHIRECRMKDVRDPAKDREGVAEHVIKVLRKNGLRHSARARGSDAISITRGCCCLGMQGKYPNSRWLGIGVWEEMK